ncbi:hypothetical protein SNK03_000349 [Fusarium graminearum]|uniref:Chromosome 1, complete genome n=2 Tax=Gibberella zeae TaxID=5518 RepID=A0A1C3YHG4_GIBZE|nr:hypothetical protein FGRA07_06793 [Fusarium graminearum]CAF3501504.1 unnamed protein product [Fusarium graminearum]CAF3574402.1 unnamed protein product [Fusarium graminearum]CAG1966941.1 unnamed protein product [Fusarium graminearum]CAG1986062.1 unnamed protein product [Fusarium graminearum]
MSQLNADAIITLVSAIPALLVASLSAWLAYLTLHHRNTSRNDIETSTIEFIVAHTSTTTVRPEPQTSSSQTSSTLLIEVPCETMPQLPPAALLGNFDWESRQTRLLPPPTMADQDQLING